MTEVVVAAAVIVVAAKREGEGEVGDAREAEASAAEDIEVVFDSLGHLDSLLESQEDVPYLVVVVIV